MDAPSSSDRFETNSATSFAEEVGDSYFILKHVDDTCTYIANTFVYLFGVKLENVNLEHIFRRGDAFICVKDKNKGVIRAYYQAPKQLHVKDSFDRIQRLVNFCEKRRVPGLLRDELFDRLLDRLDGDASQNHDEVESAPAIPHAEEKSDGDVLESVLSVFEDHSLDNFWDDICAEAENTDDMPVPQEVKDVVPSSPGQIHESQIIERRSDDELSDCLSARDALSYAGSDDDMDIAEEDEGEDRAGIFEAEVGNSSFANDLLRSEMSGFRVSAEARELSPNESKSDSFQHRIEAEAGNSSFSDHLPQFEMSDILVSTEARSFSSDEPKRDCSLQNRVSQNCTEEGPDNNQKGGLDHENCGVEEMDSLKISEGYVKTESGLDVKQEVDEENSPPAVFSDITDMIQSDSHRFVGLQGRGDPTSLEVYRNSELEQRVLSDNSTALLGAVTFDSCDAEIGETNVESESSSFSCKICNCHCPRVNALLFSSDSLDHVDPESFKYSSVIVQRCHAPLLKDFEGQFYIEFKDMDRIDVPSAVVDTSVTSSWKDSCCNVVCVEVFQYREKSSGKLGYFVRNVTVPGSSSTCFINVGDSFLTVFALRVDGMLVQRSKDSAVIRLSLPEGERDITFKKPGTLSLSDMSETIGITLQCDVLRLVCGTKLCETVVHDAWVTKPPESHRMFSYFSEPVHEECYALAISRAKLPGIRGDSPVQVSSQDLSSDQQPEGQVLKYEESVKEPDAGDTGLEKISALNECASEPDGYYSSCDCSNLQTSVPPVILKDCIKDYQSCRYRAVAVHRYHARLYKSGAGFFITLKDRIIYIPEHELPLEISEIWTEDENVYVCLDVCHYTLANSDHYSVRNVCLPDECMSDPRVVEDSYFTIYVEVVEGLMVSTLKGACTVAVKVSGSVYLADLEPKRCKVNAKTLRKKRLCCVTMQFYVGGRLVKILVPSVWLSGGEKPRKFCDSGNFLADERLLTERNSEVSQLLKEILKHGFESVCERMCKLEEGANGVLFHGLSADKLSLLRGASAVSVRRVKCDCSPSRFRPRPSMAVDRTPPRYFSVAVRSCHTKLMKDDAGFHVVFMGVRINIPEEKVAELEQPGDCDGRLICVDICQYMLADEVTFGLFVKNISEIDERSSDPRVVEEAQITILFEEVEGTITKVDGSVSVEVCINGQRVIKTLETKPFFAVGAKVDCSTAQFYVRGTLWHTVFVKVSRPETLISVNHLSRNRQRRYTKLFLRNKGTLVENEDLSNVRRSLPEIVGHACGETGSSVLSGGAKTDKEDFECVSCTCSSVPRLVRKPQLSSDHRFRYKSLVIRRCHTTLYRDDPCYIFFHGQRVVIPFNDLGNPQLLSGSWKEKSVCLDVCQYLLRDSPILTIQNIRLLENTLQKRDQDDKYCKDAPLCIFVDEVEATVSHHKRKYHIQLPLADRPFCLPFVSTLSKDTWKCSLRSLLDNKIRCIMSHSYYKGRLCDASVHFSWLSPEEPQSNHASDYFSADFQRRVEAKELSNHISKIRKKNSCKLIAPVFKANRSDSEVCLGLQGRESFCQKASCPAEPDDRSPSHRPRLSCSLVEGKRIGRSNSSDVESADYPPAASPSQLGTFSDLSADRKLKGDDQDTLSSGDVRSPISKSDKPVKVPGGNLLPDLVASCTPSGSQWHVNSVSLGDVKQEFKEDVFVRSSSSEFCRGIQHLPLRSLLAAKIPGRANIIYEANGDFTISVPGFKRMQLFKEDTLGSACGLFEMKRNIDGRFYFCQYLDQQGNVQHLICEKPDNIKADVTVLMIKGRGIVTSISEGNCVVEENRPTSSCGRTSVEIPDRISVPATSVCEPEVGEILYYDVIFYLKGSELLDYTVVNSDQDFHFITQFFTKQFQTSVEEKYSTFVNSAIALLEAAQDSNVFITARLIDCLGSVKDEVKVETYDLIESDDEPSVKKVKQEKEESPQKPTVLADLRKESTTPGEPVSAGPSTPQKQEELSNLPVPVVVRYPYGYTRAMARHDRKRAQKARKAAGAGPAQAQPTRPSVPAQRLEPIRPRVPVRPQQRPPPPSLLGPGPFNSPFGAAVLGRLIGEQLLAAQYHGDFSQPPHSNYWYPPQPHVPQTHYGMPPRHEAPRYAFFPWPNSGRYQ